MIWYVIVFSIMEVKIRSAYRFVDEIPARLRVVGVWGGELTEGGQRLNTDQKLSEAIDDLRFRGELGETLLVPQGTGFVLLFGLGRKRGANPETVRLAGARLIQALSRLPFREVVTETFLSEKLGKKEASYALAEGILLGAYEWQKYKSESESKKLRLWLARSSGTAVERAETVAQAVHLARDLVNEPPNHLTPPLLAQRAANLAQEVGLEVRIHDEAAIQAMGMGAFYAVGQGSANPPRFIELIYRPQGKPDRVVAMVGKGITFDSGGYSLKTAEGMITMKCDMSGAAAVIAAIWAVARLGSNLEVRAYVAAAENLISGGAYRVGDVLHSLLGKTIEITNTDAEGRLTLADAITHADQQGADAIVELSTLTGACVVALGDKVAGLFANDSRWGREVQDAAERAGEKVWPMPLEDEYLESLHSHTADLKNTHGRSRYGGAITAALFLAEFTDKPLVHLDIAGPAYTERAHSLGPAGGTGFGVRSLIELVCPVAD